jgi:glycosyltransferase involved in cell wall biosynthesis
MVGPGKGAVGGIATFVETLVPVLVKKVNLLYFPTVGKRLPAKSGKPSVRNITLVVSQYSRFLCTLRRYHPSIIHLHTSQGLAWLKDTFYVLLGKTCRCHTVIHVHAADFDQLYGNRGRLVQWYTRTVMRLADTVIALSEEWKRDLGRIVPAERILTLTNCINVEDTLASSTLHSTHPPKALFLGSVGPRKGAFDLLEGMSLLKARGCSLQLLIAGFEERVGDLSKAHARLGELQLEQTCHLVGMVGGVRKAELLSEASFFVLPSYHEGLPLAILEAMAAGLAVVATPVGGIADVVRNGYNGFLVSPGDVHALAEKMETLANDQHLCELMGRRSREIAEHECDVKPYINRLIALYESLVGV